MISVNLSSSFGATWCHITWVEEKPCSSSSGGPLPPTTGEDAALRGVNPVGLIAGKKISEIRHRRLLPWRGALLQTLFGVAAGLGGVYAIAEAQPTTT